MITKSLHRVYSGIASLLGLVLLVISSRAINKTPGNCISKKLHTCLTFAMLTSLALIVGGLSYFSCSTNAQCYSQSTESNPNKFVITGLVLSVFSLILFSIALAEINTNSTCNSAPNKSEIKNTLVGGLVGSVVVILLFLANYFYLRRKNV